MTPPSPAHNYQIIAYFPEWRVARSYYVKNIEATGSADKITIINYAFGIPGPDPETGVVTCQIDNPSAAYGQVYSPEMSIDGVADNPDQQLRGHFNQLKKLKARYPHIKVVVSLGGWTGSGWFSDASRTAEAREKFVAACIDLYIHGNLPVVNGTGGKAAGAGVFDGIDIDWEYPVADGLATNHVHPDDAANYVLLLQEFRKQYQAIGRSDLLLTMAGPGPGQAGSYNMPEAHPYLDLVSIMTYDFRGAWHAQTGHHTNLCSSSQDPAPEPRRISADKTIRLYRDTYGVPAEKILIGGAFYGKAWKEVGPDNHGLYQPGQGLGEGGSSYPDLVKLLDQGYTRYWDETAQAPWLYSSAARVFWTYDDPQSLALKARYVRQYGLGGVMFWEITEDDPHGSLVDAIYSELQSPHPAEDPCR